MQENTSVKSEFSAVPIEDAFIPSETFTSPESEYQSCAPAHDLHVGPFVELRRTLPSQVTAILPFVDQVMHFLKPLIAKSSQVERNELDIEIALHEALANAVVNGNRQHPEKYVHFSLRYSMDGTVSITVQDEGPGFDSRALADPTQDEYRFLSHGRGVYIMRALMDEVCFEQNGTVIRMRKSLRKSREFFEGAPL